MQGRSINTSARQSLTRSIAVVHLPSEITRGWEWVAVAWVGGVVSIGAIAHLLGRWTMTLGRGSRTPVPDWLAVVYLAVALGVSGWMVWGRLQERRTSRRWLREVAAHASQLDDVEFAETLAVHLGLDAEAWATARYENLIAAEEQVGHRLPWLWIDAVASQQILATEATPRFRFIAKMRRTRDLLASGYAMALAAVFGIVPLVIVAVNAMQRHRASAEMLMLIAAVFTSAWAGWLVWSLTRPRMEVAFVPGRAVLLSRGREVGVIDPTSSFVVITQQRVRGRYRNKLLDRTRWWVLLPGRPAVHVDDVPVMSTPWGVEITRAIAIPSSREAAPATCPRCGYPTEGLRGDQCPECGTRVF